MTHPDVYLTPQKCEKGKCFHRPRFTYLRQIFRLKGVPFIIQSTVPLRYQWDELDKCSTLLCE